MIKVIKKSKNCELVLDGKIPCTYTRAVTMYGFDKILKVHPNMEEAEKHFEKASKPADLTSKVYAVS